MRKIVEKSVQNIWCMSVQEILKNLGITKRDFSIQMGISHATLYNIFSGKTELTYAMFLVSPIILRSCVDDILLIDPKSMTVWAYKYCISEIEKLENYICTVNGSDPYSRINHSSK